MCILSVVLMCVSLFYPVYGYTLFTSNFYQPNADVFKVIFMTLLIFYMYLFYILPNILVSVPVLSTCCIHVKRFVNRFLVGWRTFVLLLLLFSVRPGNPLLDDNNRLGLEYLAIPVIIAIPYSSCLKHFNPLAYMGVIIRECITNQGANFLSRQGYQIVFSRSSLRNILDSKHGPALAENNTDTVTCLIMSHPTAMVKAFCSRRRSYWPPAPVLDLIAGLPLMLVPAGPTDFEWRCSWSLVEIIILQTLPTHVKQAYWAFKYCVHKCIKTSRTSLISGDGKRISTYVYKNVLMWDLEQNGIEGYAYSHFLRLLEKLHCYLDARALPHYFNPEHNLLADISDAEIDLAGGCVQQIIADPLTAILESAARPREVFGSWYSRNKVKQRELVGVIKSIANVYRDVDAPTEADSPDSRENINQLKVHLRCLDKIRSNKYKTQLRRDREQDRDRTLKFQRRPPLTKLEELSRTSLGDQGVISRLPKPKILADHFKFE